LGDGQGQAVSSTDEKLIALMRRLGIDAFPHHETLLLPIARISVPGAELLRPSRNLMKSIKLVGVQQAPAVVLLTGTGLRDPDATWQVIFGRRRTLAARLNGLTALKCEAYESGTPQLAALLALIENEQRSVAWIKEIQDLRLLIDQKVGMTLDELVEFGFDRRVLKERLKIAQLPLPILTAIFAGQVNEATARRIARLTSSQQERLADLVCAGEPLTAELIKSTLRRQINTGLVLLQDVLAQSMAAPMQTGYPGETGAEPVADSFHNTGDESASSGPANLAQVLTVLRSFERQLLPSSATQTLRLLTRSLIQQLEVAERSSTPIVQPPPWKAQSEPAEEVCHV
jgi:ParB-like chromosome segregation protein Spo0J